MSQDIHVLVEHIKGEVSDISYILLAACREIVESTQGEVVALLLGNDAKSLGSELNAETVLYYDHQALTEFTPDAYLEVLTRHLEEYHPRALLLGHTTIGMDLAGLLSVRLNLPIVSQCLKFINTDDDIQFVSQICAGKMMAQGMLPLPTSLVTLVPGFYKLERGKRDQKPSIQNVKVPSLDNLQVKLKNYIEPEVGDVDISEEEVLISVGRGLQNEDDLDLAKKIAALLGGEVSSSRPLIDKGWLPTNRLVGKSGKSVKPKLYFALGISGAPEHIEGIRDSDLIIAVNTDPEAPIFDIAQYGVERDLIDIIESLSKTID
jgi:electron transfer flavoprotein alpha subunit